MTAAVSPPSVTGMASPDASSTVAMKARSPAPAKVAGVISTRAFERTQTPIAPAASSATLTSRTSAGRVAEAGHAPASHLATADHEHGRARRLAGRRFGQGVDERGERRRLIEPPEGVEQPLHRGERPLFRRRTQGRRLFVEALARLAIGLERRVGLRRFLAGPRHQPGRLAGDVLARLGDRRLDRRRRLFLGRRHRLGLLRLAVGLRLGDRGLGLGDGRLGRFRPRLGVRNRLIRLRLQRVLVFGHLREHVVEEAPERLLDVEAELLRQSVGVLSDLVVKSHAK